MQPARFRASSRHCPHCCRHGRGRFFRSRPPFGGDPAGSDETLRPWRTARPGFFEVRPGWFGLRPAWFGLHPAWFVFRPAWFGLRPAWFYPARASGASPQRSGAPPQRCGALL